MSAPIASKPTLMIDSDPFRPGSTCVSVRNIDPELIGFLAAHAETGRLLRSMLRVSVIGATAPGAKDLPDVFGRHQMLEDRVRFVPHFPFDLGIRFRATFDPRPLRHPQLKRVQTLEFSLPREVSVERTQVKHVFPSSNSLPENLLRFYVCFSNPMQRGQAEEHIMLLDPGGRPAPDTLYRPPIELWDRSMRHLTVLLDPGRLKRGVGPNRELGPPLKTGQRYTLAIGSGMLDFRGHPVRERFDKTFHVIEPVRQPISVEQWKLLPPATYSRQALLLMFPKPLDWAMLRHKINIESERGRPVDGQTSIDQNETRWSFTPTLPWAAGSYSLNVAPSLEDVCGNTLLGAFDGPLRSASELARAPARHSIPFHLPRLDSR